jgi:hypothetical protein
MILFLNQFTLLRIYAAGNNIKITEEMNIFQYKAIQPFRSLPSEYEQLVITQRIISKTNKSYYDSISQLSSLCSEYMPLATTLKITREMDIFYNKTI